MVVKSVTFYIQKEHVNDFIDATLENQRNSLQEKGISVFDFYQGQDDPTRFILYEVYDTDESVESHMKTAHFEKWLAPVTGWFAKPRERVVYVDVAKID
jgi:autoinducer 2-degrading protein